MSWDARKYLSQEVVIPIVPLHLLVTYTHFYPVVDGAHSEGDWPLRLCLLTFIFCFCVTNGKAKSKARGQVLVGFVFSHSILVLAGAVPIIYGPAPDGRLLFYNTRTLTHSSPCSHACALSIPTCQLPYCRLFRYQTPH